MAADGQDGRERSGWRLAVNLSSCSPHPLRIEGSLIQLARDWAGNRIAITRGDRTWRYVYDLNGNLEPAAYEQD